MTGVPPRGPVVPVAVAEARDRVVEMLSQHFAQDRLTMEELDRRLALAYQSESVAELTALVGDLPDRVPLVAETPAAAHLDHAYAALAGRPERLLAIFSNTRRAGMWLVPPRVEVVSAFSELRIDLRNAQLTGPLTVMQVSAAFCDTKILVPAGVRVVNRITAVLGEVKDLTLQPASPDAPVIVLEGWAAFAAVQVRTG